MRANAEEHRDLASSSPSAPETRPGTSNSDKTLPELGTQQTEKTLVMKIESIKLFPFENRTPNELSDHFSPEQEEPADKQNTGFESKSSSTRPNRSGIMYDESGNPWNAEELEKKQKNPYRWFVEKEREKLTAKGPSEDETAATAMVLIFRISSPFVHLLFTGISIT